MSNLEVSCVVPVSNNNDTKFRPQPEPVESHCLK